ncbi:MAG: glycosyltransferase family 4 protein [Gammaproteobacteria bacterium]|nr:glycosyltransferase family 4 protein [Gammaproteobacteria bacterium]
MKVAIVTVQVPFIRGGAELLAEACKQAMQERNINAEIVTIPFKWYPPEAILDHIKIARLMDLSEVNGEKIDQIICLKFPAYYCQHQHKNLWLLHQHRQAYDLYNTPYGDLNLTKIGRKVAKKIKCLDSELLPEHRNIYTISGHIANKLKTNNNLPTNEVLYPPPMNADRFKCEQYENFVIYPSRFSNIKRQELVVKAMQWVPHKLKLILIGCNQNAYGLYIKKLIDELNLNDKIILRDFVTEDEKIDLYSRCLAVYNGIYDEDYGYVTIEAFLSSKPVITHHDSGGPLEFVIDKQNGFIVDPCAPAIAEVLNQLLADKQLACDYGKQGYESLKEKNISWDYTIEKLLS